MRIYLAYRHRDDLFPHLLDVGEWRQRPLLKINSPHEIIRAPERWEALAGQPVLSVQWADRTHPGVAFLEVVPDWSGYRELVLELYVPGQAMKMTAALGHQRRPRKLSYLSFALEPGAHRLELSLDQLTADRNGRRAGINKLVIYSDASFAGEVLWFGRVYLQ
jgi:hypothetical protein